MRTFRPGMRRPSVPVPAPDAGSTLIEVMVATAVISVVMAALTSFFVSTVTVTNVSGGQQTAVQLATEGIEDIRAVPVADLRAAVDLPGDPLGRWWPPGPAGRPPPSAGPGQPVRNDVRYARTWSVTACWQPPAGGSCRGQVAGYLPFLRVVVTVTWPDRSCAAASCSFTTSTLVSNVAREPVFAP